jgi:2-polyprenyl-3-methyl-5-hydroxy-6-metoxy-1,4-benzoquinol methylase
MAGTKKAGDQRKLEGGSGCEIVDPYKTFRSLTSKFHQAYFKWHTKGQYEGVKEFERFEDVLIKPPVRERDDWYGEEMQIIDRHYRSLADSHALEIGCGDGNLTWKVAQRCMSLTSCDLDLQAVELTKLRLNDLGFLDNVRLFTGSIQDLMRDKQELYDIVFLVQVLEHVPARMQAELFDGAFNLVAPGGCLFVSTPNRWAVRDSHDTGKLFIHWLPRRIRTRIAKVMNWGVKGQDPCWPCPPVLHDYVSFRWMLRRVKALFGRDVLTSQMLFYPGMDEWFTAKEAQGVRGKKYVLRKIVKCTGRYLSLNYYFGNKVIFSKGRKQ